MVKCGISKPDQTGTTAAMRRFMRSFVLTLALLATSTAAFAKGPSLMTRVFRPKTAAQMEAAQKVADALKARVDRATTYYYAVGRASLEPASKAEADHLVLHQDQYESKWIGGRKVMRSLSIAKAPVTGEEVALIRSSHFDGDRFYKMTVPNL
jgi:hypothetical protein